MKNEENVEIEKQNILQVNKNCDGAKSNSACHENIEADMVNDIEKSPPERKKKFKRLKKYLED